jgi:hypothetical protein
MNLYRSIRNGMTYWYARTILNIGAEDSTAFSNGQLPAERDATRRYVRKRLYWKLRRQGLSSNEIYAKRRHMTVSEYQAEIRAYRKAYRKKWGGDPKWGTEAYNRWFIAKKITAKPPKRI